MANRRLTDLFPAPAPEPPAFTPSEVERLVEVLEALVEDPGRIAAIDPAMRRRLLAAAGRVSHPDKHERVLRARAFRRQDRDERRQHDESVVAATEIRAAREAPVFVPPPPRLLPAAGEDPAELRRPRACYVCKQPYRKVHFFYDSMCPACAELNYEKRLQSARLDGRVALVTGGRIKIGYQTALTLLRAGAHVVVTTRFPVDAAARYAREPDHAAFADRLQIHGLDLRHAPSVELLALYLGSRLPRLDVLINNAAQTVRRPTRFYEHLVEAEERPFDELPAALRPLLAAHEALKAALPALPAAGAGAATGREVVSWQGGAAVGLLAPARLSQVPCAPDDVIAHPDEFPEGELDPDLQQLDLRPTNSWRLPLADVPTPELLEVHLVNAIAPFILNARLRPLLARDRTGEKHIINVSAMEAQFARRKKTDRHPHTNMAKAALNMMTRTSAADYATDGIWMNSVDTGWVTDEDPLRHVARKQRVHGFHPPLDIVDGAARVLDPLFVGLLSGQHPWGLFFKDYRAVEW